MADIFDVGQYITERIPNVDKLKLYKLCYFSQGWHLAWTGQPSFKRGGTALFPANCALKPGR
ncbi:hypothetical protein [Corynebacterium sp. KPL2838]|uniref:hypothetical protein n=1 Tax=Corynebacterium sp. KPL2838 TaxID=3158316 RepID=UPI0032EDE736